jgi:hypothetical protein
MLAVDDGATDISLQRDAEFLHQFPCASSNRWLSRKRLSSDARRPRPFGRGRSLYGARRAQAAFSATSTSSSIFFASPKSMRLFSL